MTDIKPDVKPRRRSILAWIAGFLIFSLAGTSLGLYYATRVPPLWPPVQNGSPGQSVTEPFHREPFASDFAERQELFIQWGAAQDTPQGPDALWAELLKVEAGARAVQGPVLYELLDSIAQGQAGAEAGLAGVIRYYYATLRERENFPQALASKRVLLDFQYGLDEASLSPRDVEYWREGSQILLYSSEYLAGQLFPSEVANGKTGRERMEAARAKINRWIDWRVRTGFSQWDSSSDAVRILAALLNLVDFADDQEVVQRATMLVDLLLLDIAVDSHYGQNASSQGRIDVRQGRGAAGDPLVTAQALLWGLGRFQSNSDLGGVSLALTKNYQLPPVLEAIALDVSEALVNLERHSLDPGKAEKWNLTFGPEDIDIWWAMGAFAHPQVIQTTKDQAAAWNLRNVPLFKKLGNSRLTALSPWLEGDLMGALNSQVNKITYRTPDYVLANAQDWRKGQRGWQQQVWQATLDPNAVVFAHNPDSLEEDSYWSSQGRLPRSAQFRNTLVALYDLPANRGLFESNHLNLTHAYFPKWAFDEVREVPALGGGGWIFGRKGEGYIALYCHLPYQWQTQGPNANQEIIALGRQNVWLVQMGRAEVDGEFGQFVQAVSNAPVEVKGLNVTWSAPGIGTLRFGWDGPLTVDSLEIPLKGYPRWDNPYIRAEFGSTQFSISHDGLTLELDFKILTRAFD